MVRPRIERAHHPVRRIWVTVLVLLLAALIAWLLLGARGTREETTGEVIAATPMTGLTTALVVASARDVVGEYARYARFFDGASAAVHAMVSGTVPAAPPLLAS
jgi:hypothetical protein